VDGKQFGDITVVLFTPESFAVRGVKKIDMEAELWASLPNAANENDFGADGSADGQSILFTVLTVSEAVPGDDTKTWDVRKTVNDAARNTDRKIFEVGIRERGS